MQEFVWHVISGSVGSFGPQVSFAALPALVPQMEVMANFSLAAGKLCDVEFTLKLRLFLCFWRLDSFNVKCGKVLIGFGW